MAKGVILIELHNRLIGLDDQGNLVLNTKGQLVGATGTPGLVGTGIGTGITITNGPGASANIANVTFQITDSLGNPLAQIGSFDIDLSDNANGSGLTATTPSGGIAAAAGGGTIIAVNTTSKAVTVQTNTAGAFVLAITDTAKTGFYPVVLRGFAAPTVGAQLTTASYHA